MTITGCRCNASIPDCSPSCPVHGNGRGPFLIQWTNDEGEGGSGVSEAANHTERDRIVADINAVGLRVAAITSKNHA